MRPWLVTIWVGVGAALGEPAVYGTAVSPELAQTEAPVGQPPGGADFEAGLEALGRGDPAAARARLEVAAKAGNAGAAAVLGLALIQGDLGPAEPQSGIEWLRSAANQ